MSLEELFHNKSFSSLTPHIHTYTHWKWDYAEALSFQKRCVEFIRQHPVQQIFLFCSHPPVFTMGKGLQKGPKVQGRQLQEWSGEASALPYPLISVKRGGGLTFHYPEQWVCYPIVSLNHPLWNLSKLVSFLLETTKSCLEELYGIQHLSTQEDLIGLWQKQGTISLKLASLGIAATHFVTYHGLALNFEKSPLMTKALAFVNPCGLSASSYTTVEALTENKLNRESFQALFLNSLHYFLCS